MARGGVLTPFFAYMQLLQRDKRLGVWKDKEGEDSHIWRLAQQLGMRWQGDDAEVRETMCALEEVWANASGGRCCAWRRATPPIDGRRSSRWRSTPARPSRSLRSGSRVVDDAR